MADADASANSRKFGYKPNTSTQPSFGAHIKNIGAKSKDTQSVDSSQMFYSGMGLNQSMNDLQSEYQTSYKSKNKLHKASMKQK